MTVTILPLEKRHRPFVLFDELRETANKDWIVKDWLGAGDASAWYGKPGDGKSVLLQELALCVAAGRPWHGHKVRQGAVVYVALERHKLIERRAIAFRREHGLTGLPFAIVNGVYDLRDQRVVDHLVSTIRLVEHETGMPVVLVIIDTLSRALCGGDENSSKDMGAIVNATSVIQQSGAHVTWIHHTPIEQERLRGHTALLGAMDVTVHIVKQGTIRTATIIKSNDCDEAEQCVAFALKSVEIGRTQDGDVTTAPLVIPADSNTVSLPKPQRKLTKAAEIALRALAEAINEHGQSAPASNHIPTGGRVVSLDVWRQQAYRRGISTSNEVRAKQQAFKRASEYLIGADRVAVWEDNAWIVR